MAVIDLQTDRFVRQRSGRARVKIARSRIQTPRPGLRLAIWAWGAVYSAGLLLALVAAARQPSGHIGETIMAGVDQFLPLQLVAAFCALVVIWMGRQRRKPARIRRFSLVPASITLVGAIATIGMVLLAQSAPVLPPPDQAPPVIWKFLRASTSNSISI